MKFITRNLKAILAFLTNVGTQTLGQAIAAGVIGSIIGFWGVVLLGAAIAALIVWVFPNDTSAPK